MASAVKVLGQIAPSATTHTAIYTVPASTTVVVSTVNICNTGSSQAKVRLWVAVANEGSGTPTAKQYILYDAALNGSEALALTIGLTLAATDKLYGYSSVANVSFQAFGQENT